MVKLVFARVPTLIVLVVSWLLCRVAFGLAAPGASTTGRWVLAASFLVGATAWGMTLRLEPVVSMLTVASLAAVVSARRGAGFVMIAIASGLAVLGVTSHPAGLVALAPLVGAAPWIFGRIRRDGRRSLAIVGTIGVASAACVLALLTLDADLPIRLHDATLVHEGELHSASWRNEYLRYARFDTYGGSTMVRHLSLGVFALALLAWTLRSRATSTVSNLPVASLASGLLLLAFVPSKWPWHFGALAGIGALALATEVERLLGERATGTRAFARAAVLLGLGLSISLWAFLERSGWGAFDLQFTTWVRSPIAHGAGCFGR